MKLLPLNKNFSDLIDSKCWVVKIGSSSLTTKTDAGLAVNESMLESVATQISDLKKQDNKQVVLVTSGAVAMGAQMLNIQPVSLHQKQACAALGQGRLMRAYSHIFAQYDIKVAQMLLTQDDWSNRERYLNMRSTINSLLEWNILPIINENDCVATEEISLGDNDTLAALTSQLVKADVLLLMTDVNGIYAKKPELNQDSTIKPISSADVFDSKLDEIATNSGSKIGRGGMRTKILAARQAAKSGTLTVIANAMQENLLLSLNVGEPCGTLLGSNETAKTYDASQQWISSQMCISGSLVLDKGAVVAINNGNSLLAVGIIKVAGQFKRGDAVMCLDELGNTIAKGMINYSNEQVDAIKGLSSGDLMAKLNQHAKEKYIIHADKLVLV